MSFNDYPNKNYNYGVFSGDSRIIVRPTCTPMLTKPLPIRRGAARRIIEQFLSYGHSVQSGRGSYVWVLVEFCKFNNLQYKIEVSGTSRDLGDGQELESPVSHRVEIV